MSSPDRVRFAPSPTGSLHIGGVRTALFNWLYARGQGGKFLLRIEDTDRQRSTLESEKEILDGMRWLGLDWDEEPVRQSERSESYQRHIDRLLEEGHAYRCACSPEEVDRMREKARALGKNPMYDRTCREKNIGADTDAPFVVRFKTPLGGDRSFKDLVKGNIRFDMEELDDFIIQRTDGSFIYNFVVAIDDAEMGVDPVIRGEDHIKNTPKQILIYEACGLEVPRFGHLPLILGPDKAPLSKRHGATSLEAFRQAGYPPAAILNYLVRLGWSHGDQEIFSLEEMKALFSIEKVSGSAGVWNPEKFEWLGGQHIQRTPTDTLVEALKPFLPEAWRSDADDATLGKLVEALREKAKTYVEMAEKCAFAFEPVTEYDPKAAKKGFKGEAREVLAELAEKLEALDEAAFTLEKIEEAFTQLGEAREVGLGKIAMPARVALTGVGVSPGIYQVVDILGKRESLLRLRNATAHLEKTGGA